MSNYCVKWGVLPMSIMHGYHVQLERDGELIQHTVGYFCKCEIEQLREHALHAAENVAGLHGTSNIKEIQIKAAL